MLQLIENYYKYHSLIRNLSLDLFLFSIDPDVLVSLKIIIKNYFYLSSIYFIHLQVIYMENLNQRMFLN